MLDGCGVAFKGSQAAVVADPRKSSFDDPASGRDLEASSIGTLHDAQPPCPCAPDDGRHLVSGISAISKYALLRRLAAKLQTPRHESKLPGWAL
jgi:hypothetical protein